MVTTAIFNAILGTGVLAMVIAPLVWAIRTQHRDHRQLAAGDGSRARATQRRERRQAPRPRYRPVTGRL